MTESKIERAAKAMSETDQLGAVADGPGIHRQSWRAYVPLARAAIEAVRAELTPSMIEAGVARYLELRDAPVLRSFLVSEVISAALGPDFVIVDNRYRSAARAAIEELRVPTDAMIAAGRKASGILVDASSSAGGPRWCELPDDEIRKAFDAMMATALDAHK